MEGAILKPIWPEPAGNCTIIKAHSRYGRRHFEPSVCYLARVFLFIYLFIFLIFFKGTVAIAKASLLN